MTRPPTEAALTRRAPPWLGSVREPMRIHKNELAFAALKRRATPATFNLVVWWRSRLGANKHVLCGAVRALEARCFGQGGAITDLGELGQSARKSGRSAAGDIGLWNGP